MLQLSLDFALFELFNPGDEIFKFRIGNLDLTFYRIDFIEQLSDPHVHQVDDELLDYDNTAKQYQHVSFVCHDLP
jgi:hypothetical protein